MKRSAVTLLVACSMLGPSIAGAQTVAETPTNARSAKTGEYISWREHIIDDSAIAGADLRGADGACTADLDGDGHLDIVTVHEDSNHVRISFGTASPLNWESITLADGKLVGQVEDVDIGDINQDGRLDIVLACEKGHIVYFLAGANRNDWKHAILGGTEGRGSWIRVKLADIDGDGSLEIFGANKGKTSYSCFRLQGDPKNGDAWEEQVIASADAPINIRPLDIDGDGDLDMVAGSRGESRIFILENLDGGREYRKHLIYESTERPSEGFMFAFTDLNADKRMDIITISKPVGRSGNGMVRWLEQPESITGEWTPHEIGSILPDEPTGLGLADINDDGRLDLITGGYSRGERLSESPDPAIDRPSGRLAWFAQPEDATDLWTLHDISRRTRGMFDVFIPIDLNQDGHVDFISTRGNSGEFDGTFWLEQIRTDTPVPNFHQARESESKQLPLP